MTQLEQARAELSTAVMGERSAEETLRSAKLAFFGANTEQSRKAVASAEQGVQASKLLLEGAQHHVAEAQRIEAEAHLAAQRQRLAELTAREALRTERAETILLELVDAERTAYRLIDELEQHMRDRASEVYERKSLTTAVGEPSPIRPARDLTYLRYDLHGLIKTAQSAEGRDGRNNGQVSVWLQPLPFAVSGGRRGA